MKKFTAGLLNRTKSTGQSNSRSNSNITNVDYSNAPTDSPEASATRGVKLFCESGSMGEGGEEVLHLPVIVDAAESSPAAAAAAAQQIRKFLTKEWASKPHVQYNSIMLIRILSDNPGPSFTRNFDKAFVSTVKEALRYCRDGGTQQILRETLDTLEANKQFQEGLEALIAMWRKEKGQQASFSGQHARAMPVQPSWNQGYSSSGDRPGAIRTASHRRALPAPGELSSRIEEAKNTAKILMQLVQSTPAEEILDNELLREFNERCQAAQRSMQSYINCDNPPPDDDTMLTLIETNEQLSVSSSRYQRALLTRRRALGISQSPGPEAMQGNVGTAVSSGALGGPPTHETQPQSQSAFASAPQLPPTQPYPTQTNGMSAFALPPGPGPNQEVYQSPGMQSNFASPPSTSDQYQAPPGPPPGMLNRLNSRERTYSPPQTPPPDHGQQRSDPFADPVEHGPNPAPLAYEPGHYGSSFSGNNDRSTLPSHQHSQSQTISEDGPEPTYTSNAQNAYAPSPHNLCDSSPQIPRRPVSTISGSQPTASPTSPERHRRWPSQDVASEIDGHSEVGRSENGVSREGRGYRS